jgi:hypothetical protein
MRRRDFLALAAVGAAARPLATRAQDSGCPKRIGVILPAGAADTEFQIWVGAFLQALAQLGWNARHQSENRQNAWPCGVTFAACARRRGDRIRLRTPALTEGRKNRCRNIQERAWCDGHAAIEVIVRGQ